MGGLEERGKHRMIHLLLTFFVACVDSISCMQSPVTALFKEFHVFKSLCDNLKVTFSDYHFRYEPEVH